MEGNLPAEKLHPDISCMSSQLASLKQIHPFPLNLSVYISSPLIYRWVNTGTIKWKTQHKLKPWAMFPMTWPIQDEYTIYSCLPHAALPGLPATAWVHHGWKLATWSRGWVHSLVSLQLSQKARGSTLSYLLSILLIKPLAVELDSSGGKWMTPTSELYPCFLWLRVEHSPQQPF